MKTGASSANFREDYEAGTESPGVKRKDTKNKNFSSNSIFIQKVNLRRGVGGLCTGRAKISNRGKFVAQEIVTRMTLRTATLTGSPNPENVLKAFCLAA